MYRFIQFREFLYHCANQYIISKKKESPIIITNSQYRDLIPNLYFSSSKKLNDVITREGILIQ